MSNRDDARQFYKDTQPTPEGLGWLAKWFVAGFILVVLIGVLTWLYGWGSAPGKVTSVENVSQQWEFAYTYHNKLKAAAQQVCSTEKALDQATDSNEQTQRRSQLLAFEQNYVRMQADYDAALQNAFKAKYVRPSDVPQQAPSLAEMKAKVCP